MSGWTVVGAAIVGALLALFFAVAVPALVDERSTADACWEAGGVPVQGDCGKGMPVVCLDRSVLIEVQP